jgi:phage repressor protein C with HTH and peptisase S24 domain
MTMTAEKAEDVLLGQALRNLREAKHPKISQRQMGAALGMSGANLQQYEVGARHITTEFVDRALAFLGDSEEQLAFERARLLGSPSAAARPRDLGETGRSFVIDVFGHARAGPEGGEAFSNPEPIRQIDLRQVLGKNADACEVQGDSMSPWAEPGEVVIFDRDRHPKRGSGCVVELHNGQTFVKHYEKSDGSTLWLKELFPEERLLTFPMRDVKGIYAVRLRGD